MSDEVARAARRAHAFEVLAAGVDAQHLRMAEAARDEPRIAERTDAHGEVVAFFHEVDVTIAQVDLDLHVRAALGVFTEHISQYVVTELDGQRQPQTTGGM